MLTACLDSIAQSVTEIAYEVIVVLNDPTPALSAEIDRAVVGATVFTFRANLGFGGAVNFAAGHARGDYIVLLNDDSVVEPGWLELLFETEQRRPRCAIVGSTFLNTDGTLQEAGAVVWSDGSTCNVGDGAQPGYMHFERKVDYASGGSLLIRKDVWDELGGFVHDYYPAYYEDVDFCLRAADAGWETWYQPRSTVRHARWTSTGANFRQFLWQRAHDTFVARWSSTLETREPNGALEHAVWKAMDCPTRVLVIDDEIPDAGTGSGSQRTYAMLSVLEQEPHVHVTFFASAPRGPRADRLALPGVRVIDDLEAHLATDGVDFDIVLVSHPHNGDALRDLLARYVPRALLLYDAESVYHRQLESRVRRRAGLRAPNGSRSGGCADEDARDLALTAADCVTCASEVEADEVRRITDTPVHVFASWLDVPLPTILAPSGGGEKPFRGTASPRSSTKPAEVAR